MLKLSQVDSSSGAPMGRNNTMPDDPSAPITLEIERLAAIDGDYDTGGAYWGTASEIWCAHGDGVQVFVRADDLAEAKAKVKQELPAASFQFNGAFLAGYISRALWSSTDGDGHNLDDSYSISDFAPETLRQVEEDCARFQAENAPMLAQCGDAEQNGHDFWLTRNGHGAGFWDRGYCGNVGDAITKACHSFGEVNLYVGDDGKIYS